MPYENVEALPASLKVHLPLRAQEIYWEAFNSGWEQNAELMRQGPAAIEEVASRSAWAAVRRKYRQDPVTGQWRLIATERSL